MYAEIYRREREVLGVTGRKLPPRARKIIRIHARRSMMERWNDHLSDPRTAGQRTVGAVQPCLSEWVDRAQGEVTFRLTQVLTGHGCFGKYLRQINREPTTACHHCPVLCDTAQHTFEFCEAWCVQRRALRAVAGEDLSLPVLVAKMTGSEEVWRAVVTFCEEVVLQKETAERIRRQEIAAPPAPAEVAAAAAEDSEEEGEPEDDGGSVSTPLRPPQRLPRTEGAGGSR